MGWKKYSATTLRVAKTGCSQFSWCFTCIFSREVPILMIAFGIQMHGRRTDTDSHEVLIVFIKAIQDMGGKVMGLGSVSMPKKAAR